MLEDALPEPGSVNVMQTDEFDESLVMGDKDAGVAANALREHEERVTPDRKPRRKAIAPEGDGPREAV